MSKPRKSKSPKLPHVIELVIGDWSHDGHEKTSEHVIYSNLTRDEIKAAYAAGVKVIGVDLSKNIGADYDDGDWLPEADWQKYVAAGIADLGWDVEGDPDTRYGTEEKGMHLDPEAFLDLYLLTVMRGNPEFKYEHIAVPVNGTLNIGGYGLFR